MSFIKFQHIKCILSVVLSSLAEESSIVVYVQYSHICSDGGAQCHPATWDLLFIHKNNHNAKGSIWSNLEHFAAQQLSALLNV